MDGEGNEQCVRGQATVTLAQEKLSNDTSTVEQ